LINLQKNNRLISINFCSQSERPRKLQNSTAGCRYLSPTKAESKN